MTFDDLIDGLRRVDGLAARRQGPPQLPVPLATVVARHVERLERARKATPLRRRT
jgi:hypothetical protein